MHNISSFSAALVLIFSLGASSTTSSANELPGGVYALSSFNQEGGYQDLEPLGEMIRGAEIVALGENQHYTGGYYDAKFRIIRYLVEKQGFRTFLWESPFTWSEPARRYVESCQGNPRVAMDSLFYYVWWDTTVEKILTWVCRYNQKHPNDPVRFSGFDSQISPIHPDSKITPRQDAFALVTTYLKKVDPSHADEHMKPIRESCIAMIGSWNKDFTHELLLRCQKEAIPGLIKQIGKYRTQGKRSTDARARAVFALETLSDHQESEFFWKEFDRTKKHEDQLRGINARDRADARLVNQFRNLYGNKKTILWAHDYHIATRTHRWPGLGYGYDKSFSAGTLIGKQLGRKYFPISLAAYSIKMRREFSDPRDPVPPIPQKPGTLEYDLRPLGPRLLLDLERNELYRRGQFINVNSLGVRAETDLFRHFRAVIYMDESRKTDLKYPGPMSVTKKGAQESILNGG